MPNLDSTALQPFASLLRQLRDIKGLRETRSGVFQLRDSPFVQFQGDGSGVWAELRKPGGSGFDRFAVATPPDQRKLIEEAKRRASKLDDD